MKSHSHSKKQSIAFLLGVSILGIWSGKSLSHLNAQETSGATTESTSAMSSCMTKADAYTHGAWKLFQSNICLANYSWAAMAENVVNMLSEIGATDADITDNSTVEGQIGGKDATAVFSTPTGTDFPYEHKAVISIEGKTKAVAYWSGSGEETKGFVIYGPADAGTFKEIAGLEDMSFGAYINWDRTGDRQQIQALGGKWFSTKSWGEIDTSLGASGDNRTAAEYIKFTKEESTGTVEDLQFIRIRDGLEASVKGANRCYRQRMWGKLSGESTESAVTYNTAGGAPDSVSETDVSGGGQMGTPQAFEDRADYPNGTSIGGAGGVSSFASTFTTLTGASIPGPDDFDLSCADVKTTKAGLFAVADDVVDFDAKPSDVFPSPTSGFEP